MIFIHLKNRAEPKKLYSVFSYATLSKLTINCSKQDAFLRVLGERLTGSQEVRGSPTMLHHEIRNHYDCGFFYVNIKLNKLLPISKKQNQLRGF